MAQSIAYNPRAWTKEGIFFRPILAPTGGVYIYENKILLVFKKVMSLMFDRVHSGNISYKRADKNIFGAFFTFLVKKVL